MNYLDGAEGMRGGVGDGDGEQGRRIDGAHGELGRAGGVGLVDEIELPVENVVLHIKVVVAGDLAQAGC